MRRVMGGIGHSASERFGIQLPPALAHLGHSVSSPVVGSGSLEPSWRLAGA